ncbi:glycosyltransferase [Zavarzinia compransoris]|uniref:glycosyltransferase family A protein n=1 Tax=Zavarzinia marina TaxID=2911065 RepID=UPI001F376F16|nr:glycosyltransferase family A protein [Zavarzinia marina]MCF4164204.1 glycosyltransferase [Zavarzinia marina]
MIGLLLWLGAAWALGAGLVTLWSANLMRRRVPPLAEVPAADVLVIIPATGPLPRLEALVAALDGQRPRPARVVFSVESEADPAHARIAGLIAARPASAVPLSLVVAGEAETSSQKCRNQAAALRAHGDAPFIVFADADILPPPDWLAHLLRPLARNAADIVTGYRWPLPLDHRAGTVFGAWIDRAVAGLPKPNRGWLTWGGSIALSAKVVERLDLAEMFERTLSDDLALAGAARAAGLRIIFRGAVLVPTPFHHSLASLLGFGRRQYQMFRIYQPWLWAWAGATVALNFVGSLALVALALGGGAGLAAWAAGATLALLADRERRILARRAGIEARGVPAAEGLLRLMPLVLPLVHGLHLAAVVLSVERGRVVWGHCTYRMTGRRVTSIERQPWSSKVP